MTTETPQRYTTYMPAAGIASFLRLPIHEDLDTLDADVAVMGIPYDVTVSFRPGARFGPRSIREYSARYAAWGTGNPAGYWDINTGKRHLAGVSMVDCGDVDVCYYDVEQSMSLITQSVGKVLKRGALPVLLGGDHSVTFPTVMAYADQGPIDIVHIDAHLDWRNDINGLRFTNASPLRRCKEQSFVREMLQFGIRDIRSREQDFHDAREMGARIYTRQSMRETGIPALLDSLPDLGKTFITIDIDGLDPSIAPGTGSPTVDGLLYHEVRDLLQGIAARSTVVGFDLVEVNPSVDLHGQTSLLATTLIMEVLGAVFDDQPSARTARRP